MLKVITKIREMQSIASKPLEKEKGNKDNFINLREEMKGQKKKKKEKKRERKMIHRRL